MRGLEARARLILDRRLRAARPAPLTVAVSGGGDSLALALIAADWAAAHDRRLLLINIDHGLQAQSQDWAQACAALAERLNADFAPMRWTGEKPTTGLPAAARAARHRLLAQAAREAGASVILIGHTAGDRAEAQAMRAQGGTTPDPREWSPSPVWPEGRGVFLLRPLIDAGREEIRAWLAARGETWIDDPANTDPRYARARARAAGAGAPAAFPQDDPGPAALARATVMDDAGGLSLPRALLREPGAEDFVAMACLCAAGTDRIPRGERLTRLAALLAGEAPAAATLAGARIEADETTVRFLRDAGEAARGGLADQRIEGTAVWDGRFEITTDRPIEVRRLGGLASQLSKAERIALSAYPAKARAGLPVIIDGETVTCPLLTPASGVSVRLLAYDRLLAAAGTVASEP